MSNNRRFTRGTFPCSACARLTRGTPDSAAIDLCGQCYEIAGLYNSFQDGVLEPSDAAYILSLCAEITAKGGKLDGDAKELLAWVIKQG